MRGGPDSVPASWPNANRYTEAIIVQLLSIMPRVRSRLDDVTKAYYDIRQLILQNAKVMNETSIQLPEISRGTLRQW
ncbi:hypothetical protein DPMN_041980 [Dreissena polymorpha]|nr:hypothetical protein DPMN_071867 [Dreissena polymorpha]KAH3712352.1 hypothetical protein DPMN_072049 [Dreissena polymorpha]KAH3712357.1 hypothetical protein DPMN_072055 [Dreissena polymorpha]KAH3735371.1 hypothetical protein DPMN_041890 [Dreissena polymorpha]KAH3735449.1 hypothetical protein DPMN_041980 [Dreissena polymorpha]